MKWVEVKPLESSVCVQIHRVRADLVDRSEESGKCCYRYRAEFEGTTELERFSLRGIRTEVENQNDLNR